LHKFIDKKVIATQKLNAYHCKEQLKTSFSCMYKKYWPFFFGEGTVNRIIYRDMFELWLMSQLLQDKPNVVLQHDEAPPHIHNEVTTFLNRLLPERCIGRWGSTSCSPWFSDLSHSTFSCEALWKMGFRFRHCQ